MTEQDRNRAIVVLDLLGEGCTEENIEAWLASGDPKRLPCGCVGVCDARAHDTAPDWDGKPSGPSWDDMSSRERVRFLLAHPYCQFCGDNLSEYDVEMGRNFCKVCAENSVDARCEQCGNGCQQDERLCLHCATENAEVEARVNEFMEQGGMS